MATKIGLHAFQKYIYLHEYFEPILFFNPHGKFGCFWRQQKRSQISETGEATQTKIGLHAFRVNHYLHEFFEPILFLTPMEMVWRKLWLFLGNEKWAKSPKPERPYPPKLITWISHQPLLAWIFWSPWTIVYVTKGKFGCFEGKRIQAKSLKPGRSCPLQMVCMHFTSTSTTLFFDPHGCPWF